MKARLVQLDWERACAVADDTPNLEVESADELSALLSCVQRGAHRAFTGNQIISPNAVARVAALLERLSWEAVAVHHRPAMMSLLGFPSSDPIALRDDYLMLRTFYLDARARRNAVYCDFS